MNDFPVVMTGFTDAALEAGREAALGIERGGSVAVGHRKDPSLIVMPHDHAVRTYQRHRLDLPSCCPFSGNPQRGSTVTISYRAKSAVLEVYALGAYLKRFIGGYGEVRTMEGMIERIAADCAEAVGVMVRVRAKVLLQEGALEILTEARP